MLQVGKDGTFSLTVNKSWHQLGCSAVVGHTGNIGREGAHGSDRLLLARCCRCCGDAVLVAVWFSCKGHPVHRAGNLQTMHTYSTQEIQERSLALFGISLLSLSSVHEPSSTPVLSAFRLVGKHLMINIKVHSSQQGPPAMLHSLDGGFAFAGSEEGCRW